ncbi:MAG: 6-phosphogluconolactonase [Candidatus Latescibacterota bacterium]
MTIRLAGGLDVLVLGLGKNAHIGFNEPGSDADSIGRVLPLTPTSIDANREWFGDEHAPDMGVTTGMKTLLEAKTILLLAFGAAKSTAVEAMLDGPPTPACPASFLQVHPDTHIFIDTAAAACLPPGQDLREAGETVADTDVV